MHLVEVLKEEVLAKYSIRQPPAGVFGPLPTVGPFAVEKPVDLRVPFRLSFTGQWFTPPF